LVTLERPRSIDLWNVEADAVLQSFRLGGDRKVTKFSPDGRLLATPAAANPAKIYDVATGKEVFPFRAGLRLDRDWSGHSSTQMALGWRSWIR